jgi:hypothetical protein
MQLPERDITERTMQAPIATLATSADIDLRMPHSAVSMGMQQFEHRAEMMLVCRMLDFHRSLPHSTTSCPNCRQLVSCKRAAFARTPLANFGAGETTVPP